MPYKLTRAKADEFHNGCPSGTSRHTMGQYSHILEDARFDIGDYNRYWLLVYGINGDREISNDEMEKEIAAQLRSTECYF